MLLLVHSIVHISWRDRKSCLSSFINKRYMSSDPRMGQEFFFPASGKKRGNYPSSHSTWTIINLSCVCVESLFLVSRPRRCFACIACPLSSVYCRKPSWWYPSAFKCIYLRHWKVVSPIVYIRCRPRCLLACLLLDDDDSWGLLTKATNHGGLDKSCLPVTISQSENDSATSTLVHKSNARTEGRKQQARERRTLNGRSAPPASQSGYYYCCYYYYCGARRTLVLRL